MRYFIISTNRNKYCMKGNADVDKQEVEEVAEACPIMNDGKE
jgi:hypothetical protein